MASSHAPIRSVWRHSSIGRLTDNDKGLLLAINTLRHLKWYDGYRFSDADTHACNDDLNGFMTLFQSFLASISYDMHLPYEKIYQTVFYVVFKLLAASVGAESRTNEGRINDWTATTLNQ